MAGNSNQETDIMQTSWNLHSSLADSTEQSLSIEVINDVRGFDGLRDEWSNLVQKSTVYIFQTYEWQRLWWEHFGHDRSLHIVLFRHEGVLVGIAPFFLDTFRFLGVTISRNLCLLGSDVSYPGADGVFDKYSPSDYLDIIALPEFEKSVASMLLKHLSQLGKIYEKIVLDELPEDSVLMRELVPKLRSLGWKSKISRREICPRLHVPSSVADFKRALNPKVRYQLFQTRRAVTEQGLFSVEAVQSQEALDRSFSEFVGLHQRRWNRLGYPGTFANEQYKAFLHDVTRAFLAHGWLWFRTAKNNGRCIAAQCAFKYRDRMYDYLKAFDDEAPEAKRRPGRALLLFLIEEAIQDKIRVVDFLRGGEKYKFELTPDGQFNSQVVIPNPFMKDRKQSLAYRALVLLSLLQRRFIKEAVLLRVHSREWGMLGCTPRYIRFLWKRLRDFLRLERPGTSPGRQTSLDSSRVSYGGPGNPGNSGLSTPAPSQPTMDQTLEASLRLELEVITDTSRFLTLRDEWNHLVDASPVSIFQTFDWQWLWWKYFGDGLHLHIITFRSNGKLVGVFPLYLEVFSLFGLKLYRRLRFMGGGIEDWKSQWDLAQFGPSDYLDVIALPEYQMNVASSFLAYFRKETSLDEAELENIPQESLLNRYLIPLLKADGLAHRYVQDHVCPRITLPASLEDYLRTRSAKFRYQLSQTRKAVTKQRLFSVKAVQSKADLHNALPELVRLHQQRWNRIGYPGIFADSRFRKFQEEVSERFLESGRLWFKTVHMDGDCIAARMGFRFKDSICDYSAGFDDRSPGAKRRPGFALLLSMIEDAIQDKKRIVDLLRGYETYKFDFTSEIANDWKIVVWNSASRRTLRVRLYRIAHYLEFLMRKALFEWAMFKVHYREHGLPMFLFRYLAFRSKKLSEKVVNDLKMARSSTGDQ